MTTPKHVHKLRRHRYSSGTVTFFCMLPDCAFKINPALAIGKRSICHRCGEEFIMTEYSVRLAKPHCEACHKPKVSMIQPIEEPEVEPLDEPLQTPVELDKPMPSLQELRSRFAHSSLMGKADDEGDL